MEDDKVETLFPLPFWAVVLIAAFCFPVMTGCASAPQMPPAVPENVVASFQAPHTNARLYSEPCRNAAIMEFLSDKLPPEVLSTVKSASGTYEGKAYGVCWFWIADGAAAVVVWDDNGYFAVPRNKLKFPLNV